MGVSKSQAIENKEAIVASAEKLFRERGVADVGLSELTKAAGFTQGGFYNHFKSKEALVAAVMEKALADGAVQLRAGLEASKTASGDPMSQYIDWYLSDDHLGNIETGCPLIAYAGDVRRLGDDAQASYANGLSWNIDQLAEAIGGDDAQENRKKAVALFSQMVGALVLARAVVKVDATLAHEILEDGHQQALRELKR